MTTLIPAAGFEGERTTALVCGPEVMMRFVATALRDRGVAPERIHVSLERNMKCAIGHCGHCQLAHQFVCKDGPVFPYRPGRATDGGAGAVSSGTTAPKLAGLEVRLLRRLPAQPARLRAGAGRAARTRSTSPTSSRRRRGTVEGPYDLSLVEGSITTPEDAERIQEVRRQSRRLVTIGACATSGGIQALRNFADVEEFISVVYAEPDYISTLENSTPISANVHVDFELQGCPVDRHQLLEVISAFLNERQPADRPTTASASSASGPATSA